MSMGTTVVATDTAGRLVVLHTERHCDDLPETVPLVDEELAEHLGLGDTDLRFTRVRDGESFWFDDAPDEPSTPSPLAVRLASVTRLTVDCSEVDEVSPSQLVGPPEPVAAALRAELEAAWRGFLGQDATVGPPIPSLSVRIAEARKEAVPDRRDDLRDQPVSTEEIEGYLLMRAGFLLGFEGRSFAPFADVLPDATDADRASYLRALTAAIDALPEDSRQILYYRQISEWADTATVADHEARFGRTIQQIAAVEETVRAALREAGAAWMAR
ncbi:MAG: hypothetical protein H6734_22090 [Alphaproteobacteria bacterium]|nr:hypothetical protein [Alphaproteobacteria bacterium]